MKTVKLTFRHATAFCRSAAPILTVLALSIAGTSAVAQTDVFVPGNATGFFGNPPDILVPALTVSGPGEITVTYVSGTVTDIDGSGPVNTGPDGVPNNNGSAQLPLREAVGVQVSQGPHLDALIGVFVPQSRAQEPGFSPVDGTKGLVPVGIMPDGLFFIGKGKTFSVSEAGTLSWASMTAASLPTGEASTSRSQGLSARTQVQVGE
jgi:hypothetical protein